MEKGYFEFDDQEVESIRQELIDREMRERLKSMTLEELDNIFNACVDRERVLEKRLDKLGDEIEKVEAIFDDIEYFIKKYLVDVYLEEHGVDIREEGHDIPLDEDGYPEDLE
jgi:hypothetical protein